MDTKRCISNGALETVRPTHNEPYLRYVVPILTASKNIKRPFCNCFTILFVRLWKNGILLESIVNDRPTDYWSLCVKRGTSSYMTNNNWIEAVGQGNSEPPFGEIKWYDYNNMVYGGSKREQIVCLADWKSMITFKLLYNRDYHHKRSYFSVYA